MKPLREVRRAKLISIEALSKTTQLSTRTIVDAELGRTTPQLGTIKVLSDALGVDPMDVEEFARAIRGEPKTPLE